MVMVTRVGEKNLRTLVLVLVLILGAGLVGGGGLG